MSSSGAVRAAAGSQIRLPSWRAGNYYASSLYNGSGAGLNFTANQVRFSPLWCPKVGGAIDRLSIITTIVSTAGGVARLGLYADDGTGTPGALVLDGGTVDTTAGPGLLELTVNQVLGQGLFWTALVEQGGPVTPASIRSQTAAYSLLGYATPGTTATAGYLQDGVAGALPNPAVPSNFTFTGSMPVVYLRAQ